MNLQKIPLWSFALLSGLLIGFSYIPFPPYTLMFCFIPLWYALLQKQDLKHYLKMAWITQFILSLIGFHWVTYPAIEFARLPLAVSFVILILFASFIHLHYLLAYALAYFFIKRRPTNLLQKLMIFALCHALAESIYPMLFPWHLAYSWLSTNLPLVQTAEVWGFQGLSFFTLIFNACLAVFLLERTKKSSKYAISFAVLFFIFINALGSKLKNQWQDFDKSLQVLIVQANIGNFEKIRAEEKENYRPAIVEKYRNLAEEGLASYPTTELLVFPETALPLLIEQNSISDDQKQTAIDMASLFNKDIFTGVYSTNDDAIYNSIGLFSKNSAMLGLYSKSQLLAFGETFPGAERFPWIQDFIEKYIPAISYFGRGKGPSVLYNLDQRIGPQICYEGLDPHFTREISLKGANLLINLTNDSWFGNTFEPYQHMYMTLARALEVRRPLIRATNTGISTAILADGTMLQRSPLRKEWFGLYEIKYKQNPPQTFYAKFGYLYDYLVFGLIIFVAFFRRKEI